MGGAATIPHTPPPKPAGSFDESTSNASSEHATPSKKLGVAARLLSPLQTMRLRGRRTVEAQALPRNATATTEVATPATPKAVATESSPRNNTDAPSKQAATTARVLRSPFQAIRLRKRRRARSAPPVLRTPLLEQHFRVDRGERVVLPGVIKHEEDLARDTHDFFNLIVLLPIIALNIMNWNWEKMANLRKKETIVDAWHGDYFDLFFGATVCYFVVDLLWIIVLPKCVKSPSTIVQHHLVTMLYILIPYFRPSTRWGMGACMSVEINTWFLIARRVFNKQGFPPWIIDLSFVSIRVKLISLLFYITWIGIRCILYPIMWVYLLRHWWAYSIKVGTKWNVELVPPVLHSSFCILNFKWTYDLLMSKIRYWKRVSRARRGGVVDNKAQEVSKGL